MPNPAPDTGPADRDPERFTTTGEPTAPSVRTGTAADQAAARASPAAAAPATPAKKRPTSKEVITEWLRGNSSIRATDDSDFSRSADDLIATLDNAGHTVEAK